MEVAPCRQWLCRWRRPFRRRGAGGEISFENEEFLVFLVDEILAAAFGELLDGFFALLDERLQQLNGFRVVERAHLSPLP